MRIVDAGWSSDTFTNSKVTYTGPGTKVSRAPTEVSDGGPGSSCEYEYAPTRISSSGSLHCSLHHLMKNEVGPRYHALLCCRVSYTVHREATNGPAAVHLLVVMRGGRRG